MYVLYGVFTHRGEYNNNNGIPEYRKKKILKFVKKIEGDPIPLYSHNVTGFYTNPELQLLCTTFSDHTVAVGRIASHRV